METLQEVARETSVVKFRVICDQHALFPGFFCQLTNLVFISTFKDNNGESHWETSITLTISHSGLKKSLEKAQFNS